MIKCQKKKCRLNWKRNGYQNLIIKYCHSKYIKYLYYSATHPPSTPTITIKVQRTQSILPNHQKQKTNNDLNV